MKKLNFILICTLLSNFVFAENYVFKSRFDDNVSVNYEKQVFEQVLVQDFKSFFASYKRGQYPSELVDAKKALSSRLQFKEKQDLTIPGIMDASSRIHLEVRDLNGQRKLPKEVEYSDLNIKDFNLLDSMAGSKNELVLLGWKQFLIENIDLRKIDFDLKGDEFVEPDDFVEFLLQITAKNMYEGDFFSIANGNLSPQWITNSYTTIDGIDIKQLLSKFLYGAIHFYQVSAVFLTQKGIFVDNAKPINGSNYTLLESNWDQAFGYFGASTNYLDYSDLQLKKKQSIDYDKDGEFSLKNEFNYGASVVAAKIDLYSKYPQLNLNQNIYNNFVNGRKMIVKNSPDLKRNLLKISQEIIKNWEKAIAGSVIHYINRVLKEMNEYGTYNYLAKDHFKFWGEMKGFALSFQFNPSSPMKEPTFKQLHKLLGDKPVLMHSSSAELATYKRRLLLARQILQRTYKFTVKNAESM